MKCSKCGEECRENQAFCLRCGTPIQVVPDFNLIEAELANSVGKLMKEEKQKASSENKNQDLDYLEDEQYVTKNYIPRDKRASQTGGTKRLADTPVSQTDFLVDGTGFSEQTAKTKKNSKNQPDKQEDIKREKKIFKIKLAIFSIFVIIILTIAVLLLKGVSGSGSKESFASKYNQGYDYYTAKAYNDALVEFLAAKKITDSKEDKIKVNKSLLATYEKLGSRDTDMIEILKELIELEPKEADYYDELAQLYDKNEMIDELDAFLDSITDVSIASKLSEYSVSAPQFSQKEGVYDTYISIKLSSAGRSTIYYTIDGSEPTTSSTQYKEEIKLTSQGTYTIKALAVNEKGVSSKIVTKNYEINPSVIEAPVVVPSSGEYTAAGNITVNVPEGMKCYYTYGETSAVPTVADQLYTEPVPMLRGKYIFSAVLVSADGKTSEVTQNVYQLTIPRNVDYSSALTLLESYLIQNQKAVKAEDGTLMKNNQAKIRFSYNSIMNINNNEYFVINLEELNDTQQVVATEHYGVDTVTGSVAKLIADTEHAGLYKITE
ncbi:MAG: hypothetical protein HFI34_12200 [Lachnospiraceae bacterium]|nr:hypothetical protein [Lachnospiraceae bacterium]